MTSTWLARQETIQHREHHHAGTTVPKKTGEWVTIDGEGWGRDELGRQFYRFMIAANADGFQSYMMPVERTALTTVEALHWLVSLPYQYRKWCQRVDKEWEEPRFGGFALGYDYAHILTDITKDQLDHLLSNSGYDQPATGITDELSVRLTAGNLRIYTNEIPPAEVLSIWDTFKYFQAAFLKVMRGYASDAEWQLVDAGKNRRDEGEHSIQKEMLYCLTECRVHSRAMNELTDSIRVQGLHVTGYYGPGSLAAAAYRKHRTKEKYWKPDDEQPAGLRLAALSAYVGGRFETTGHGWLPRMFSHDIRSAYPAAMPTLPCLKHGRWEHVTGDVAEEALRSSLAVGKVEWHCENPPGGWGPYPMRRGDRKQNTDLPIWPFDGRAWVWSEEFQAGLSFTSSVAVNEAWVYKPACRCNCFEWVPHEYQRRQHFKEIGSVREKIIKLMINSLYGKLAQSIGNPPLPTWIWAGLITQSARAKLLRAISTNPAAAMMVATDAVYSTEPLELNFGTGLGQWDGPDEYGRTLVIQAGFWKDYDSGKAKTRGIAQRYVDPCWPLFESLWDGITRGTNSLNDVVGIRYSDHIGLQRARTQGIQKLGRWVDDAEQLVRFGTDKRPILIGEPVDGWWRSAPKRRDLIGMPVSYCPSEHTETDQYFIMEQPDAAEWGYED